ncbi:MAG TPA: Flp family type IVb pilin [Xanthobacteraceae bacterium]|jgi:pilus assembly protein Flp/PilA|nr:Flp family type IVb pilin [Xanthobacteraceae bacterium]
MRAILRFAGDNSAATSIEYALIAAGIAVAIVTVVQGLGTSVKGMYSSVSSALN